MEQLTYSPPRNCLTFENSVSDVCSESPQFKKSYARGPLINGRHPGSPVNCLISDAKATSPAGDTQ